MATDPSVNSDASLQYLKLELAKIDILIQREVRRWQAAGQDAGDSYRGLYVTDSEVNQLIEQPIGFSWGQNARFDPKLEEYFQKKYAAAEDELKRFLDQSQENRGTLRLRNLVRIFALDPVDLNIFLICLAPSLDLKYERIYGYLQDDVTRKQPGINLVLNTLASPGINRFGYWPHFLDEAPLFRHQLLEKQPDQGKVPLLRETLAVDETIVNWLLGSYQPRQDLESHLHLIFPTANDTDLILTGHLLDGLPRDPMPDPHFIFTGIDTASHDAAARLVALKLNRPLLSLGLKSLAHEGLALHKSLLIGLRDALLTGSVLHISGWDSCLGEDGTPAVNLLTQICAFEGPVIISGISAWQVSGISRTENFLGIHFPVPSFTQRCTLWQHYLVKASPGTAIETSQLAGQFTLTASQIRDACATAVDACKQADRDMTEDDLFTAARSHSNPRLSRLAKKVVPHYGWDDIVLPSDQFAILHEIIGTVCGRPKVLEEWGVGDKLTPNSGVTVLFSGPPGTGKTMAAQIVARELGLDLYKIDLSSIVSKYIGETEKNMERIFSEAESSNAILFFDEADALFGKRSEVRDSHDRYANIEISYLLQRMEAYDGVTILATNLRANLDEAFTRRLQFAVNFPFPDEADRLRIWKALFPPELPRDADIDFHLLARRFKVAGGNIRNIIVNAAYLASADGGKVKMGHLFHSTQREYQKLGRLLGDDDLRAP